MRALPMTGGLHPQITDGYTTTADFLNSGLGFCARRDDDPICSASTDFTHQGRAKINLEFTVGQVDRRIELATCAAAVLACLEAEIEPHWRNVRSHGGLLGQLAKGLGYIPREEYEILAPKDTGAEDEARRLVRKTDI